MGCEAEVCLITLPKYYREKIDCVEVGGANVSHPHAPEHAEIVARAVVSACRLEGWQSPVQPKLLHTLFNRLLGQDLDFETIEPLSSAEAAGTLGSSAEREELIQLMVAIEILCNPIPERLERSVVQGSLSHPRARGFLSSILSGL